MARNCGRVKPLSATEIAVWHHHQAFGLRLRSCLPLPELLETGEGESDVEIAYAPVPPDLPDAVVKGVRYQAAPGRLLLIVDRIARYLITDGRRIDIDRQPEADDADVRVFLLGSALGALLHQRRDLVLHGSAIAVDGQSVGFLGRSGIGKSTTAMAFRKRGYPVLTDDLCIVRPDSAGRPAISPGFPQAKLWLDSLQQLEVDPGNLGRIRRKLEKRALPLRESFAGTAPLPVKRLYLLQGHHRETIELRACEGPAKFAVLKSQTYRFQYVGGLGEKPAHFQLALALAQRVPLIAVTRPSGEFRLAELIDRLEADLRA